MDRLNHKLIFQIEQVSCLLDFFFLGEGCRFARVGFEKMNGQVCRAQKVLAFRLIYDTM